VPPVKRRTTSADVARASGVSRATVSYVMNDASKQTISGDTRRRVLEAAELLGYTPNAPARALRSGRSDVVLFLIPEWPIGPAIASLVEHLSQRLAERNLTLVVHAHPRSARSATELWKAITAAAVINHQALTDEEVAAARRAGMLVITPVFQRRGHKTFPLFQRRIGHTQVEYLARKGHRRLGFALPDDDRLLAFATPRLDGARRACTELELSAPVPVTVGLDRHAAATAVDIWTSAMHPVTGICAYNDEVALAVLAGMRARSLTAPSDLAVIGVDDIPAAALGSPALTTVATGMGVFGEHLAELVVCALDGQEPPARPGEDILQVVGRETT
jgi:DNA-binding LacI/PurR family transcriptional regulator